MPRKSKKRNPPPLKAGEETLGKRIARLRKERGYTQTELAKKIGTGQGVVSDYERGKLRPYAEIIIRFAQALEVSADELLGLWNAPDRKSGPDPGSLKRLKRVEALPSACRTILLNIIDTFLRDAESFGDRKK